MNPKILSKSSQYGLCPHTEDANITFEADFAWLTQKMTSRNENVIIVAECMQLSPSTIDLNSE